ncbi:hypothetical protein LCGC14_1835600 [marine sediment metagenome]|uniref:Glycosyl transferase family 1 domain-containing protein n=1 Tax=marine sediment metagenome TaxID=412755 RepID=A0A0F9JEC6_9ZZZZ
MSISLMVVGDGFAQPTGLARIARDLTARLRQNADSLGIEVSAVGWQPPLSPFQRDWYLGHQDSEGWGAQALSVWWAERVDPRTIGVVLTVWDPARCHGLRQANLTNAHWWGYFPIDAEGVRGSLQWGPAAETVQAYDRVLGYGRFGAKVLETDDYLPHGIDTQVFYPRIDQAGWEAIEFLAPVVQANSILVGCVAANQPRKDFALLFAAVAKMREVDRGVRLWLHTDTQIGAWAIPQLAADYGLQRALIVTTSLTDDQLAAAYTWCAVTIAPGLGEGFGKGPTPWSARCSRPRTSRTRRGERSGGAAGNRGWCGPTAWGPCRDCAGRACGLGGRSGFGRGWRSYEETLGQGVQGR